MHIYLKHFLHGSKVAISDMEAEADEKNGWTRYNLETPVPASDTEIEVTMNALGIKRKYTRKAVTEEI